MSRWRKLLGRIEPPDGGDDPASDVEAIFRAQTSDPRVPAPPGRLIGLLAHVGAPLSDGIDAFTLEADELGAVGAVSGRITICDPLVPGTEVPSVCVSGGAVTVVRRVVGGQARNGAALMRLSDLDPVEWRHLGEYGVSTGVACFADPEALAVLETRLAEFYAQGGPMLEGEEPLVDALAASSATIYHPGPDHQIAAFSSGLGDGVYPAWLGVDQDGAPCCVLTSFDTIAAGTQPI